MNLFYTHSAHPLLKVIVVFSVLRGYSFENVKNVTSYKDDFKIYYSELNTSVSNRTSSKRDTNHRIEHSTNYLPCQVKNRVLQPIYGTSLSKKDLVQIVQIQPILIQNVIVGKCQINYQDPGKQYSPYHCRQRYSAVELYVLRDSEVNPDPAPTSYGHSFIRRFDFPRELIIVESGCDFSLTDHNRILGEPVVKEEHDSDSKILDSPYNPISYNLQVEDYRDKSDEPSDYPRNKNPNETTKGTTSDGDRVNYRERDQIISGPEGSSRDRKPQRPERENYSNPGNNENSSPGSFADMTYTNSQQTSHDDSYYATQETSDYNKRNRNHNPTNAEDFNHTPYSLNFHDETPVSDTSEYSNEYQNKEYKSTSSTVADRIKYHCENNPTTIACRYLFFRTY